LLLTIVIVAVVVTSAEVFARVRGFAPSINDDADLWCSAYQEIQPADTSQVVLVGASRFQVDLDLPL